MTVRSPHEKASLHYGRTGRIDAAAGLGRLRLAGSPDYSGVVYSAKKAPSTATAPSTKAKPAKAPATATPDAASANAGIDADCRTKAPGMFNSVHEYTCAFQLIRAFSMPLADDAKRAEFEKAVRAERLVEHRIPEDGRASLKPTASGTPSP